MHEYTHKILELGKYKITIDKNVHRADIEDSSKEETAVSIVPCEGAAEFYSCV